MLSRLSGYGPSTAVLGITVGNVGRSDLYVSAVFISDEKQKNTYFPPAGGAWPAVPCLLKSGDSENWYLDTSEFKSICDTWNLTNGDGKLDMRVSLKDGRAIRVRRQVKVEELRKIWNVSKLGTSARPIASVAPNAAT